MTNPKTDHKSRKPTSTDHPARRAAAAAPGTQTGASHGMIEACDRLGQKLDQVAEIVREQIEAWRQLRPSAAPPPDGTPQAGPAREPNGPSARPEIQSDQGAGPRVQARPPDGSAPAPTPGAPGDDGVAGMAKDARRLVDTLARARNGWQEQAAGVRQALEAIMAYLESQAVTAVPAVDVDGIMSRLRDLEERQQSLQSQVNTNRLGP